METDIISVVLLLVVIVICFILSLDCVFSTRDYNFIPIVAKVIMLLVSLVVLISICAMLFHSVIYNILSYIF